MANLGTYDPMASAVFPAAADVLDTADSYGPTGTEYDPAFDLAAAEAAYEAGRNDAADPGKVLTTEIFQQFGVPVVGLFVEPPQADVKLGTPVGVQ